MSWIRVVNLLAGLALLLTACGAPTPSVSAPGSPSPTPPSAPTVPAEAGLSLSSSPYGMIIVDRSGRTLYLFDLERNHVPRCYGACAVAWPPMPAQEGATPGPGLNPAPIAMAVRTDGTSQLTYNGHPLYYYAGDHSAGEIKCQAAIEFGGGWYVIDAQGNKISAP